MIVTIGNVTYRISEEGNGDNVFFNRDSCRLGVTYYPIKSIILYNDLEPDLKRKTLIHELTHAYANEFGFDSILNEAKFDHELLADFMGAYAVDIVRIAEHYMEDRLSRRG